MTNFEIAMSVNASSLIDKNVSILVYQTNKV